MADYGTDYACIFAATPAPLFPTYEKITAQPGCCVIDGTGSAITAYGLNNTCHVLKYIADGSASAPYRITILERDNAGGLDLTDNECISMDYNIVNHGTYSTGNGMGPNDAGLASKYGFDKCKVGAGTSNSAASAPQPTGSTSAAEPARKIRARYLWLLGMVVGFLAV